MKTSTVDAIVENHKKWIKGEPGGERADLQGAYLQGTNLRGAYLQGAYLQDAYLSMSVGVSFASVSWSEHGECGRTLTGVKVGDDIKLFCGCFNGSVNDLKGYIDNGDTKLKASRTIAFKFIIDRFEEMEKGE